MTLQSKNSIKLITYLRSPTQNRKMYDAVDGLVKMMLLVSYYASDIITRCSRSTALGLEVADN